MTLCKIVASTYVSPHRTHHWCGNTSLAMFWSINVVLEKQCFEKTFYNFCYCNKKYLYAKKGYFTQCYFVVYACNKLFPLDWITL